MLGFIVLMRKGMFCI